MEGGEVNPDTFIANWLHVEGRGRGGRAGISLDTFTGTGCIVGPGEGGVRADTTSELLTTAACSTTWF